MPLSFEVSFSDVKRIEKALISLGRKRGDALRSAVGKTLQQSVGEFRKAAPVDTGALRKSLGKQVTIRNFGDVIGYLGARKDFAKQYNGVTKRPVLYIKRVEQKGRSKGWMARTWGGEARKYKTRLKDEIWRAIAKYAAKYGTV